jgi:hypothetical protein
MGDEFNEERASPAGGAFSSSMTSAVCNAVSGSGRDAEGGAFGDVGR